eukprot:scaffold272070_cov22-Tisochrysis_lutea.AAC.1
MANSMASQVGYRLGMIQHRQHGKRWRRCWDERGQCGCSQAACAHRTREVMWDLGIAHRVHVMYH